MTNTNTITTETLNNIAKLIQSVGVTPTKEMVISFSIKTLVDAGYEFKAAYEMIFGEGSHKKLVGDVYDSLRAA
jgi:hypothetical protein